MHPCGCGVLGGLTSTCSTTCGSGEIVLSRFRTIVTCFAPASDLELSVAVDVALGLGFFALSPTIVFRQYEHSSHTRERFLLLRALWLSRFCNFRLAAGLEIPVQSSLLSRNASR